MFISFFIAHPFLREKMATNLKNMPLIGNALRIQFIIVKFKIKVYFTVSTVEIATSCTTSLFFYVFSRYHLAFIRFDCLCSR